jgi:hypothetical protein
LLHSLSGHERESTLRESGDGGDQPGKGERHPNGKDAGQGKIEPGTAKEGLLKGRKIEIRIYIDFLQFEDDQPEHEDDADSDHNYLRGKVDSRKGGSRHSGQDGSIFGDPRIYHFSRPPGPGTSAAFYLPSIIQSLWMRSLISYRRRISTVPERRGRLKSLLTATQKTIRECLLNDRGPFGGHFLIDIPYPCMNACVEDTSPGEIKRFPPSNLPIGAASG